MPLKILSCCEHHFNHELPTNTVLVIIMISKTEGGQTMLQLKDVKTGTFYYVVAPGNLCTDITTDDVIYRDENCICELCIEIPAPSRIPSTGNAKYKLD